MCIISIFSSTGTSVIQVTATDADDQTYGNSAKLVYSILQGQPYFSVDSDNGNLITTPTMGMQTLERSDHVCILSLLLYSANRDPTALSMGCLFRE